MATMSPDTPSKNIVIIGGGIIGSTTAYYLTRHPSYSPQHHKITLLEATSIASGASGKAGGLLALWAYPKCLVPLSFRLHRELAEEHGGKDKWGYRAVGVGNIELVGRKIPKTSIRASLNGTEGPKDPIDTAHKHDISPIGDGSGHDRPNDNISLQKELGISQSKPSRKTNGLPDDLDWIAEGCAQGWMSMGSPTDTAQVHPYQFTTSIAELAQDRGVTLKLGKAEKILVDNGIATGIKYTDSTTHQSHTLEDVTDIIVTAGPWTQRIWPGAPIGHLRAHSVCIRPSRPVSAYALFTDLSLPRDFKQGTKSRAMNVSPEIYARPNNELYACGEGDHLVPLPETSADVEVDDARCQDIVDYCAAFSDEMRDGQVLVRQACYLPMVEYSGAGPLVGPTRTRGVWVAAGHTCWGIQNGPATGKVMSEFIFDGEAKSANVAMLDPRTITKR